ncbi:MAG: hypothetical protein ACTSUF_02195 [Candidatus Heimdallarchaeaceae archaeon]
MSKWEKKLMSLVRGMSDEEVEDMIGRLEKEIGEGIGSPRLIVKNFNTDEVKLIPVGDIHYGARECDKKLLKGTLDYIEKSGAYVIGMGDYIDCATRNSVSDIYTAVRNPMSAYEEIVNFLEPIKDRIFGLHIGNHEYRIWRESGINLVKMMAKELDTKYLGFAVFTKLRVKNQNYSIYSTHGSSGAWTPEGKLRAVRRLGESFDADVYCFDEETEILTADGWKRREEVKIGDIIYNLNLNTDRIEKDVVLNKIETNEHESYNIEMSSISQCLSPNQRVIYKYEGKYLVKSIKELAEMSAQIKIPLAGVIDNKDFKISDDELKLAAWIISEGHFKNEYGAHKAIAIFQRIGDKAKKIETLLERMELDFSIYKRDRNKTDLEFYIKAKDGAKIRKLVPEKNIPDWVFRLSKRQFDIFLETLMEGDGHKYYDGVYEYYSANEELIDRLQAACTIFGYRTRKYQKQSGFADTVNYALGICNRQDVSVALSKNLIEHRIEEKKMWDVTTFNGTVIIRRNGKVSITGNCMGHVHDLAVQSEERRIVDYRKRTVKRKKKYYILTGHFLNYEDSYAEMKAYKPGKKGVAKIKFYGDKWDIHCSI